MLGTKGKRIHGVKDAAKKRVNCKQLCTAKLIYLPVAAIDFWKRAVYARNQKLQSGIREVSPVGAPTGGWQEFTLTDSKA